MKHDDDWHAILIRDVSPAQIWFRKARGGGSFIGPETYGDCKLGGFQWAKVCGNVGADVAVAPREKQLFWPPEVYNNISPWSLASEVWSLGATVYMMMTGIPPPRVSDHAWQIFRMNDRGFSGALREVVGAMLDPRMGGRPDALSLVGRVEEGWRGWRGNEVEGLRYVDGRDRDVGDNVEYGRAGRGIAGSILRM